MDCRVFLFGGAGDGLTVTLQQLATEIEVLLENGVPVALPHPDPLQLTGTETYRLVGPPGPEMPVYVRA